MPKVMESLCSAKFIYNLQNSSTLAHFSSLQTLGTLMDLWQSHRSLTWPRGPGFSELNKIGIHVSGQLLRCGTSPGANHEEARGAESKADFIHKLGIVLKELKESRFWIKVIIRVPLLQPDKVAPLLDECEALIAIIAKSIFTARKTKKDQ